MLGLSNICRVGWPTGWWPILVSIGKWWEWWPDSSRVDFVRWRRKRRVARGLVERWHDREPTTIEGFVHAEDSTAVPSSKPGFWEKDRVLVCLWPKAVLSDFKTRPQKRLKQTRARCKRSSLFFFNKLKRTTNFINKTKKQNGRYEKRANTCDFCIVQDVRDIHTIWFTRVRVDI